MNKPVNNQGIANLVLMSLNGKLPGINYSSVSIVTRPEAGWLRNPSFSVGVKGFSLVHSVHTGSVFHPTYYWTNIEGSSREAKGVGHVTDHSPPSSAKVGNARSPTFAFPYAFMTLLGTLCRTKPLSGVACFRKTISLFTEE